MEIKKIKHYYLTACLMITIIGSLYVFYAKFVEGTFINVPLKYSENKVETNKLVYEEGDEVLIHWKYCKGTNEIGVVNVNIIDGIVYFLPPVYSSRKVGCYDSYVAITHIPKAIPSGTYYLKADIEYKLNPINTMHYQVESNKFEVVGNDNKGEKGDPGIQGLPGKNAQ